MIEIISNTIIMQVLQNTLNNKVWWWAEAKSDKFPLSTPFIV